MNPTSLVRIVPLADLTDGIPVNVNVEGVQLVVASYKDNVSVFDGVCPHQGTLLGDG